MIAAFVIVFAGVVIYSMRQRAAMPIGGDPNRCAPPIRSAYTETGKGTSEQTRDGKVVTAVSFARQLTYSDGKIRGIDVDAKLTDKHGRPMRLTAKEAELVAPPGQPQALSVGKLTGDVKLTTDDGLEVTLGGRDVQRRDRDPDASRGRCSSRRDA